MRHACYWIYLVAYERLVVAVVVATFCSSSFHIPFDHMWKVYHGVFPALHTFRGFLLIGLFYAFFWRCQCKPAHRGFSFDEI